MSVAFLVSRLVSIGDGDLQLLEKNRYAFVAVLVTLEHAGQEERSGGTSQQLSHQLGRLGMVDLALCLCSIAQQLETVLDRLPLLSAQARGPLTTHAPSWSSVAGGLALFAAWVVSAQAAIGQASCAVQATRPSALLVAQARTSLVFRVALAVAVVLGDVAHGAFAHERRARGRRGCAGGRVSREVAGLPGGRGGGLRAAVALEPAAAPLALVGRPRSALAGAGFCIGVCFAVVVAVEAELVTLVGGRQGAVGRLGRGRSGAARVCVRVGAAGARMALHGRCQCAELAHQRVVLALALALALVDLPRLLARARPRNVGAVGGCAGELDALALLGHVRIDELALGGGYAGDGREGRVVRAGGAIGGRRGRLGRARGGSSSSMIDCVDGIGLVYGGGGGGGGCRGTVVLARGRAVEGELGGLLGRQRRARGR